MTRYTYQRPLMGQLGPNPLYYGDGFSISFPVEWSLWTPDAEDIAGHLQSRGLAHDVVSGQIAGIVNPYLSAVGRFSGNWNTASSGRDALLSAIAEMGFDIDYNSVKFKVMPRPRSGSTQPAPAPAPRPSTPAPAPTPKVRPRPGEPEETEEGMYFAAVEPLPQEFYQQQPYTPPQLPKKDDKGVSPLVWLGFGLLAVVLIARD
jgi:hypothetical protein